MRCKSCRDHLSAWRDGELSPQLAAKVKAHVEKCQACQDLSRAMEQTLDALERLPSLEPSAGFDAAFKRRLQKARASQAQHPSFQNYPETFGERGWGLVLWRRSFFRVSALAAAGAVAGLALAFFFLKSPPGLDPRTDAAPHVMEMAAQLELFQNYEVIDHLDALEDFEVVAELDSLLEEAS